MNIDELNLLHDKAKTRKDGVYSFKGYLWVVKNNRFVAYSDYSGNCYQRCGNFNAVLGKVDHYDRKKKLTEWLKNQKLKKGE